MPATYPHRVPADPTYDEIVNVDTTVRRRAGILEASGNESAVMCAQDALACLGRWIRDEPFPGKPSDVLPSSWAESALEWCQRGREHAFGFIAPEGW